MEQLARLAVVTRRRLPKYLLAELRVGGLPCET